MDLTDLVLFLKLKLWMYLRHFLFHLGIVFLKASKFNFYPAYLISD